ncbi:MAG: HNH endonuclease [Thermoleophilaceae bacterium]
MTQSEVARALGIAKSTVSYHARALGRPVEERFAARYDWDAVRRFYEGGKSLAECQERFGFNRSAWYEAIARRRLDPRSAKEELKLTLNQPGRASRGSIKRRLISLGLKSGSCERCGINSWRDRPLTIALHHVHGEGGDNRLENLQFLCPNCHSQTDSYGGRNAVRPTPPAPPTAGTAA